MIPSRLSEMPLPGPEVEIVRVKAMQSLSCIALSRGIHTYRTHWDQANKATIPCFEPHDECEGHRRKLPQRAKGYLHVWLTTRKEGNQVDRKEAFLELTPVAAFDLRTGLGGHRDLRGIPFTITRLNGSKAHLKVAVFLDNIVPEEKLPAPRSPYESLMRLWGFLDFPPENDGRRFFE